MRLRRQRNGFTIIELLIVVIVIGILAAAGLAKYQNFAETSRRKTCLGQLQTIENALAVWETNNGAFAENAKTAFGLTPRTGRLTGCGAVSPSGAFGVAAWMYAGLGSDNVVTGGAGIGALTDVGGQTTVGGPAAFCNAGAAASPTAGPLSSIIRDDKVWICPSVLSRYYGGEIQNVPDDYADTRGGGVSPTHGGSPVGYGGRYFMFVCGLGNKGTGVTPLGTNGYCDTGGREFISNQTATNGPSPVPQVPFKLAICGAYGAFGNGGANVPGTTALQSGGSVGPDGSPLNRHSARW